MFLLDVPVTGAHRLVSALVSALDPLLGGAAAAVAIVLVTMLFRTLLLPLAIAAARGEKARAKLLPEMRRLQHKHRNRPDRLQAALADLQRREGASMFAGLLPALGQAPVFMVMYRLFSSAAIAGQANGLLAHTLLGVPLGQSGVAVAGSAGVLSAPFAVYAGLLALLALVAWSSARRLAGPLRVLPYATVAFAWFVPLAAGVYLLASGLWTAGERAVLHRRPVPA